MARPVRFNIHPKGTNIHDNIALADMPEGDTGYRLFCNQVLKRLLVWQERIPSGLYHLQQLLRYRIYGINGCALRFCTLWFGAS